MLPDGIADAALLAAQAPAGGVLPPRDDGVELARLDLWADRPSVARSKLAAVAKAFGPRLQIQEGFRLLINSGELAPTEAAALLSRVAFDGSDGPLVAAVRGEEVLDQLEALIAAGCKLQDHTRHWPLVNEARTITKAWAAVPERLIGSSQESGATVVITRQANEEELRGGQPASETKRLVAVDLIEGYEIQAMAPHAGMLESVPSDLRGVIACETDESSGRVHVTAVADGYDEAIEIARQLELTAGTGAFDQPLAEHIRPRLTRAWIEAPIDLIEFGADIRTASDWAN